MVVLKVLRTAPGTHRSPSAGAHVDFAFDAHGDISGQGRTDAVGKLGPDPIAEVLLPVVLHAATA